MAFTYLHVSSDKENPEVVELGFGSRGVYSTEKLNKKDPGSDVFKKLLEIGIEYFSINHLVVVCSDGKATAYEAPDVVSVSGGNIGVEFDFDSSGN